MDSLKISFSIPSLLVPPQDSTDEYNSFINSSKYNKVENMLDFKQKEIKYQTGCPHQRKTREYR